MNITVWTIDLKKINYEMEHIHAYLDAIELKRLARYYFNTDKNRFLAAHMAKRSILSRLAGVDASALKFKTSPLGKPVMVSPVSIHFNITYSGDLALLAVADYPVGIDLEQAIELSDVDQLAAVAFNPDENAMLLQTPSSQKSSFFLTIWTMKEAWLKAKGDGLSINPSDVCIPFSGTSLPKPMDVRIYRGYACCTLHAPIGYVASVALLAVKSSCLDVFWRDYKEIETDCRV